MSVEWHGIAVIYDRTDPLHITDTAPTLQTVEENRLVFARFGNRNVGHSVCFIKYSHFLISPRIQCRNSIFELFQRHPHDEPQTIYASALYLGTGVAQSSGDPSPRGTSSRPVSHQPLAHAVRTGGPYDRADPVVLLGRAGLLGYRGCAGPYRQHGGKTSLSPRPSTSV